ncbi:MAG: glycosyltransferase [Deltaproteobacteria bacterium]|nr:glycosyltransferase [Deltaproteobacteria bacterium]
MNHLLVSYHTCPMEEPGVGLAGGMNVFLRGLLAGLAAHGIFTDVLTRGKRRTCGTATPFPGVRIFHLPCGWTEPPTRESAYRSLPRFVREARDLLSGCPASYDAVSAHYWMSGVAAREIFRRPAPFGVSSLGMNRLLLMYHTLEARKTASAGPAPRRFSIARKREEEKLSREAGRVVFLSRHDFERTRKILPAVAGKGSIVPPGVEDSFRCPPSRREARRTLGVPGNAILFLLAARPDPGKNVEAAVRAFRALRKDEANRLLLLVAGQEASGREISEGIAFAGAVPHAGMPSLYAAADAVLCPSEYESFGLVPLEAMAAGAPPVVPLGGYWGKRIRSRGGGLAYAPGRGDGLTGAIRLLSRDGALRKRLAEEGRKAAAEFTWERCTASWVRLLSKCARPGNRR